MTYEESLTLVTDNLLPGNLEAKILYHLSSLTKNGQQQAKCAYLYKGIEYQGIIFSEGNEKWFKDIEPGTVVKAEGVKPSTYSQYAGKYIGSISPLNLQLNLQPQSSDESYPSYLVRLLREAADYVEDAFSRVAEQNIAQEVVVEIEAPAKIKSPVKLKYKQSEDWEVILKNMIKTSEILNSKEFSGISLNAYIDVWYKDWEGGDLEMLSSGPRWKSMVHSALMNLLNCNFIERVPGTKKHYQLAKEALADCF